MDSPIIWCFKSLIISIERGKQREIVQMIVMKASVETDTDMMIQMDSNSELTVCNLTEGEVKVDLEVFFR